MKCPRCQSYASRHAALGSPYAAESELVELADGGPLSALTCARCGGGLLPEDGTARLLEELGHGTEALRELARHYGGERLTCPACRSRMSPLALRGAKVDVCFGCGSVWLDAGELESITGGRHRLPVPAHPPPPVVLPAQSLVRVDERTLGRHVGRSVLAGVGAVGVVWWLVGLVPALSGVAGVAALAAAAGLSRRESFDVLPRARRMLRWRGFFAPGPREAEGEEFSPDSVVVVRRAHLQERPLPWVNIDLVDAEGRDLARLRGPVWPQRAWTEAPRLARALGVSVRFDVDPHAEDVLEAAEAARAQLPAFTVADAWRIEPRLHAEGTARSFMVADFEDRALASIVTELPPREAPLTMSLLLDEHFVLQAADGPRARLHSTVQLGKRTTLVVGPGGAVLGHVAAVRGALADTFTWKSAHARRTVNARLAHGSAEATLTDGWGRVVGVLEVSLPAPGEPRPVSVRLVAGRAPGLARWGVLALALHVSLAGCVEEL